MQKIDDSLVSLAYDVVALKGKDHQIDFGEGSDYQGELHLSWNSTKFEAFLIVYSDPFTSGIYSPVAIDPPETIWREEEDEFEAVKIRDVAGWLKRDWGFELTPTNPPNKRMNAEYLAASVGEVELAEKIN